jgi:hypothetical protein
MCIVIIHEVLTCRDLFRVLILITVEKNGTSFSDPGEMKKLNKHRWAKL